ncbi:hypothetical protein KAH55_03635, partial [bacterium]|nr:hypothetical protein [bacterium]
MLQFEEQNKSFFFRTSPLTIKDWHINIQVNDSLLGLKDARIESGHTDTWELFFQEHQLQLSIKTFWDDPKQRLFLNAKLHNHSDKPLRLGKVRLFESDDFSQFSAETVCLPLAGNLGQRKVWQITDPDAPQISKIKTVFFDSATQQALLAGFVTFHQIDTNVTHTVSSQGLATLSLDCDFHGWEMPAKSNVDLETMYLAVSQNPYTLLENWADLAAERCHPRKWADAPIGWLGWSWVDALSVENYQETLIRNCKAIRDKLGGFDIRYVWISMGNLVTGSPGEWDQWNYKNFPDGPEYLSSKLQQIGFKFGLWCAPFWLCGNQKKLMTHFSDALLQNPDGTPFIAVDHWRYGISTELPLEERPPIYQLDPTHPKVQKFLSAVFTNARNWGVRYYMIDFLANSCGPIDPRAPITGYSNPQLRPGPETYFAGLDVIRQAVGDDVYLLTSTGPNIHNAGFADGIRTGNDFGEGRAIAPD